LVEPLNTSVELAESAVTDAFRNEWGRVVASLVRRTGDWDLAEECAQGAFEKASRDGPVTASPIDQVPGS